MTALSLLACGAGARPEGATPASSDVPLASVAVPVGSLPPLVASEGAAPSASAADLRSPAPADSLAPLLERAAIAVAAGSGGQGGSVGRSVGPCAEHMTLVGRFCIDRYEAHLASFDEGGNLVAHAHNERPVAKVSYLAVSAPGVFPQGYMSRIEADSACKKASKRLCSMTEWRTACSGKRRLAYPYGNRREPGRCASSKKHLLSELYGKNGKAWKYDEHFNNPELLVQEGFLDRTGVHEGCQTDGGVFDLVGNLHEWVKDTVTDELVERMEEESVERRKQPYHVGNGVFMGGFFSTTSEHGPGCSFTTIAHEPAYHDYSIGFRCCSDAKLLKPPLSAKLPVGDLDRKLPLRDFPTHRRGRGPRRAYPALRAAGAPWVPRRARWGNFPADWKDPALGDTIRSCLSRWRASSIPPTSTVSGVPTARSW